MKILLVNGSPRKNGCTHTALEEFANTIRSEGMSAEIFHIGTKPISGCTSCSGCARAKKCVIDDCVNEFETLAKEANGFVFGSPVYYAGINGAMMAFMDRLFFSDLLSGGGAFYLKPVACIVSARRAGTTAALEQLQKYPNHAQMPIISSKYWPMVHGNSPDEVKQDREGLQIVRMLARNMAWFLKIKEAGSKAGIPFPEPEPEKLSTNFIR